MQRWMQAKVQLAKSHGTASSGANRAMGSVLEDRPGRAPQARDLPPPKDRDTARIGNRIVEVSPVKRKVRGVVVVLKEERPVAWGKGRKARRAATK